LDPGYSIIIIIIDNRGLNARWCLTPLLLSLPTAAYLGQLGLTPAGLPHTTAQCHLTILGEAVRWCHLNFFPADILLERKYCIVTTTTTIRPTLSLLGYMFPCYETFAR